jgi:membrane protease YdiL (CAAX protease family)
VSKYGLTRTFKVLVDLITLKFISDFSTRPNYIFGGFGLDTSDPWTLVPALVFGLANGVMEEVAYRGALMGWSARVIGLGPSLVLQALVFGLAHSGPDVIGSELLLVAVLTAGGLIAGLVTVRTRSLALPIAIHVALDLPLYVYLACRVP